MFTESTHFMFAGGGRPGHFFPGLAVAQHLRRIAPHARITFLGMDAPFERKCAKQAAFSYRALRSQSSRSLGLWKYLIGNNQPHRAARALIKQQPPSVVIGMGGEGSVPALRAAMSLEIPIALLEQNHTATPIARRFAPYASAIFTAGGNNDAGLDAVAPVRRIGSAIRGDFTRLFYERNSHEGPASSTRPRLLVLTGAGPSRRLNSEVPKALYKLRYELRDWEIVHQSGSRDASATQQLYRKLAVEARVVPFVGDLAHMLRSTDLVIGRAGGLLLAELAAGGVPAVLVTSAGGDAGEQEANARYYVQYGAGRAVNERGLTGRLDDALVNELRDPIQNRSTRQAMSRAMRKLARPDAAWHVASMLLELTRANVLEQVA
jgi:UDP-N-acetylglucosamine--N-acetylmuramyl-(pentapeptide) pyrophosphoryl-undecaprenol N-acetylglucosamine transferase